MRHNNVDSFYFKLDAELPNHHSNLFLRSPTMIMLTDGLRPTTEILSLC